MPKTVCIISDLHCGHKVGLCPPSHFPSSKKPEGVIARRLWNEFEKIVPRGCDILIVNGDAIDGKGERSGGCEQITTDRDEQADMAAEVIRYVGAEAVVVIAGTPYHTGQDEDWEKGIAKDVGAIKFGSHETIRVEGVDFDVKHFVPGSQVPHGRHTAIARDRLWEGLWAEYEERRRADVIVRSHVHYHSFCGGPGWLALTTPALQGLGSKYGSRKCMGIVDFGLTVFECNKGEYKWEARCKRIAEQQRKPVSL